MNRADCQELLDIFESIEGRLTMLIYEHPDSKTISMVEHIRQDIIKIRKIIFKD